MNVEHENLNNIHCLWIIEEYQEKFDESPGNIATSKIKKKLNKYFFLHRIISYYYKRGVTVCLGHPHRRGVCDFISVYSLSFL